jgi:magnesium-transporting ATPase (P-type)
MDIVTTTAIIIIFLIIALWIALICLAGHLARKKGRSYFGFFCLSLLFSPVLGIILACIVMPYTPKMEEREFKFGKKKKCLACAEIIKIEAKVCKYCGSGC